MARGWKIIKDALPDNCYGLWWLNFTVRVQPCHGSASRGKTWCYYVSQLFICRLVWWQGMTVRPGQAWNNNLFTGVTTFYCYVTISLKASSLRLANVPSFFRAEEVQWVAWTWDELLCWQRCQKSARNYWFVKPRHTKCHWRRMAPWTHMSMNEKEIMRPLKCVSDEAL